MKGKHIAQRGVIAAMLLMGSMVFFGCTQESQNKISRSIQNWTGVNGVLDVYAGEKLVKRFIKIDKLSTAQATGKNDQRPYRYGYGVDDLNFNLKEDEGEERVYFEVSDFSTNYVFYEDSQQ